MMRRPSRVAAIAAISFISGCLVASFLISLQMTLKGSWDFFGKMRRVSNAELRDRLVQNTENLILPPSIWTSPELREGACPIALPDDVDKVFFDKWKMPYPPQCKEGASASKLDGKELVEIKNICVGDLTYRAFDGLELGPRKKLKGRVKIANTIENIIVQCDNDGYRSFDFHVRVTKQKAISKRAKVNKLKFDKPFKKKAAPLSVVVLMLDSVTREHMIRSLPRTLDWMKRSESHEMLDYTRFNTVGRGTKMNFTPVFFGNNSKEFEKRSEFTSLSNLYEQAGYVTSFVEEACITNTGTMGRLAMKKVKDKLTAQEKVSFMEKFNALSDHSFGNVFCDVMKSMEVSNFFGEATIEGICFGGKLMQRYVLQYLDSFVSAYYGKNTPVLAIAKTNEGHERSYARVALMDDDVLNFIQSITKRYPNTAIVLMGDHGIGYGELSETFTLSMEYNLPALFFLMPNTYMKKALPKKLSKALRENQHKLVTGIDLHATLADFVYYKNGDGPPTAGVSFLREIKDRSCEDLGIPSARCSCSIFSEQSTKIPLWRVIAEAVIYEKVNKEVAKWELCAQLGIKTVKKVRKIANEGANSVVYQITAVVTPQEEEFIVEVEPKPTWKVPADTSKPALSFMKLSGIYKTKETDSFQPVGLLIGIPDQVIIEIAWRKELSLPTRQVHLQFVDEQGKIAFNEATEIKKGWETSRSTIKKKFLKYQTYLFRAVDKDTQVEYGSAQFAVLDPDKQYDAKQLAIVFNPFYTILSLTRQSPFARFASCLPHQAPAELCICDITKKK